MVSSIGIVCIIHLFYILSRAGIAFVHSFASMAGLLSLNPQLLYSRPIVRGRKDARISVDSHVQYHVIYESPGYNKP